MKRGLTLQLLLAGLVAAQTAYGDPKGAPSASIHPVSPFRANLFAAEPTDPSEPPPLVDPEMSTRPEPEPFDQAPPKDSGKRIPIPGIVLIGIGSVGIAIGIAGIVVAGHKGTIATNDAKAILKGGGLCQPLVGNYGSKCSEVASATSAHNTWQKVGRGGLAVGIAAATAGIIYLLWPDARPKPKTNIESSSLWPSVVPILAPTESGIQMSGAFE